MDDGSASVEESLGMLRMEAQQGISHVVATPHFYARYDSPEHFLQKREHAMELLKKAMQKMVDLIAKEKPDSEKRMVMISHCNCRERAEKFKEVLLSKIKCKTPLTV